ncbi:MAG: hypothetical protein MJ252_29685 [archaeon]|nr:hypothetical protein [archaeon]
MSNKGLFIDRYPSVPAAGKTSALENLSADQCIRQDLFFKSQSITPAHLQKYRRTLREIPGRKQIHYGIYDDPKDYENLVHGLPSTKSEHVPDCIKGENLSGTKSFIEDLRENRFYASRRREPLGRGLIRSYIFPEEVRKDSFKFGVPTVGFNNAKDLIYSSSNLNESPEVKALYAKTHGLSEPGQQINRRYNWNFDVNNHVFGLSQEMEIDGAKKSLSIDTSDNLFPKTRIVDSRLENFRQATSDVLGMPKYHGTLNAKIGPDHVFGLPAKKSDNWTAGKCIFGDPKETTIESVEPDKDLGRSCRFRTKLRNLKPIEYDPERICGVSSVRKDLPKRAKESVTNLINYGDEEDAFELLYPHPCATMGVKDKEFGELQNKEEIFRILKDNGYNIPEEELNTIYDITIRNYPNEEGKISYQAFISTLRNLKKEYNKYKNIELEA